MKYDYVFYINILNNTIFKKNIHLFNDIVCSKKKIFLEYGYYSKFNYKQYIFIRNSIFNNKKILNDTNLNTFFLNNNILFNNIVHNVNIQEITTKIRSPCMFINDNINRCLGTILFEEIFNKKNIDYKLNILESCIEKCPITYDNLHKNLVVTSSCKHSFSFTGFINNIYFNSCCPICQKSLLYSTIYIKGSLDIIINNLLCINFNKIVHLNNNTANIFLLETVNNCDILKKRLTYINALDLKNNYGNCYFSTIEMLRYSSIDTYNIIYIHIIKKYTRYYSLLKTDILTVLNYYYKDKHIILNEINLI